MKKIICLALVLGMAFAFTACGGKGGDNGGESSSILDSSAVSTDASTETSVQPTTDPSASSTAESSAASGTETSSETSSTDSTESSSASSTSDGTIKAAVANAPDVNIRAEANTNCSIVGTAAEGDAYEVVSEDDGSGFIGIKYGGATCYISSTYAYIDTVTEDELTVVNSNTSDSDETDDETSSGVTAESTRENEDGMKR